MNKKIFASVGSFFLLSFILVYLGFSQTDSIATSRSGINLEVKVNSPEQVYIQGELINLNFEVNNAASSDIFLKGADVNSGYLKVFIAASDQNFKVYSNSVWGTGKTKGLTIKAGESIKSQTKILWNFSPVNRFSNLEGFEKSHILTDYAFPAPGIYLVKAVLYIPGENPVKFESKPIQIVINEPAGDDLKVWTQIKDNGSVAYFIQQGETPTYEDEKAEKLLREIEQIVSENPNGILVGQIKQKLEKFRINREKRKEMLEKAKVKPKN